MGQSASSHQQNQRFATDQQSPYASAVVRKTADFGSNASGGLKRANGHHSLSSTSTTLSSQGGTSTSASATRYIPNMKDGGKGLVMPRGGAPMHAMAGSAPPADPSSGVTSPDSWGFHINITPTQELYAANGGLPTGPYAAPRTDDQCPHLTPLSLRPFTRQQQENPCCSIVLSSFCKHKSTPPTAP
jgi:hypothetical protein